ncbi:hypothetical protein JCGZ_13958 [Jatropha curcas]|uniref:RING-type E3 ubiquitin transferase n=1 Tax=Jatropha curcas TaxID=180498 RepID=A0A067JWC4_JATCU|nr:RING-H2 finger protein ATL5 [Jatropha curcas]KDP28187.1 hypothetical protein JCGZ_13958 [Jatropha curcas]
MENFKPRNQVSHNTQYVHDGKIMLCTGIILFTAISIMICFNSRRRCLRESQLSSSSNTAATDSVAAQGLDPSTLKSLPTFVYSAKTQDAVVECAVCLSELQDGDEGRVLPKCNHAFHICCIDMWFHSHSNCPLCRAPVQSGNVTEICTERVTPVLENGGIEMESGRKKRDESGCSASSSPVSLSLSTLECQRKSLDLVTILVEVPTATGEQRP